MKTVASHALGCKVNQYESEAIAELFCEKGYEVVDIQEPADVYIINTCTVTNFGDKKSRQLIRRVKRQNPDAIVAVVGCYAQTAPDEVMKIDGVNLVIGTKGRADIIRLVEEYDKEKGIVNTVGSIDREREFEHLSIQKLTDRTRAYLKIQDGCSQFCSYCIIPYARGPIRSREPEDILLEVKNLALNGFKEVVLAGIHVASYGKDLKNIDLLEIIKMVHEIDGIERIRFSSIEPNIVTDEFLSGIVKLPKVCRHIHLSLQSGCQKTLEAMNRKYSAEKYRQAVKLLRQYIPDIAITTDIIAGFPGETDDDFNESLEFAKEMKFSKIHAFPYSPKKGTPAAIMANQISNEVKNHRTKRLIELSDTMASEFVNNYLGKEVKVLFEHEIDLGIYEGHTSNYIRVQVPSNTDLKNKLLSVTLEKTVEDFAIGKLFVEM